MRTRVLLMHDAAIVVMWNASAGDPQSGYSLQLREKYSQLDLAVVDHLDVQASWKPALGLLRYSRSFLT